MATVLKTKMCNSCKNKKNVNLFYKKSGRTGLAAYSSSCISCINILRKEDRKNNPAKYHLIDKAYYHNNKTKIKQNNALWRYSKRKEILELLGGKCCRCGFDDVRALQVDHVNGGGHQERKITTSVNKLFKDIKKIPEKYQLLCANCNWIKRYENKEYAK